MEWWYYLLSFTCHTTFSDLDCISRSQQHQTVWSENFMFFSVLETWYDCSFFWTRSWNITLVVTFAFIDTFLYQQNLEHLPVFPRILCEWSRLVMAWLKPCLGSTDLYQWPWRERWMSDFFPLSGLSGLSFDSTLLSPFLFICLLPLLFLSQLSACSANVCFSSENSSIFFVRR